MSVQATPISTPRITQVTSISGQMHYSTVTLLSRSAVLFVRITASNATTPSPPAPTVPTLRNTMTALLLISTRNSMAEAILVLRQELLPPIRTLISYLQMVH